MPVPFHRSLRALEADGFRRVFLGILAGAALLAAWLVWAFTARVAVFARSSAARLEVGSQAHPVEPAVAGIVIANHLALGQEVAAGDALVELDATRERLELAEATARLTSLGPQLAARRRQLGAENAARQADQQHTPVALAEARARADAADTAARQARDGLERSRKLSAANLISPADLVRAETEAERMATEAQAQRLSINRVQHEQRSAESDRRAQIDDIEREAAALEGDRIVLAATIQRLAHAIDQHVVRAPVAGRVADLAPAPPGLMVKEGDRLATLVPAGAVRLVAELAPEDAVGRVRPGQRARFRLAGFPWMQYGSVAATVAQVGTEVRDGHVRVELILEPAAGARVPVEHGLPGSVEIELEQVSPAILLLRAAGRLIDAGSGSGA